MMWKRYDHIFSDGMLIGDEKEVMIPDELDELEDRVRQFVNLIEELSISDISMTPFFVSYDISNNRVRTQIMNYLLQKGMTRLQRSVYFGQANSRIFNQIKKTLQEINSVLEPQDSIFLLPVNREITSRMNFIGMDMALEVTRPHQHTLFI